VSAPSSVRIARKERDYLGRIPSREKKQDAVICFRATTHWKTHALGYVLVRIASGHYAKTALVEAPPPTPPQPIVLYAKVREESSSLVIIQRELLSRLTADDCAVWGGMPCPCWPRRKQAPEGELIQRSWRAIIDRGHLWRTQAQP